MRMEQCGLEALVMREGRLGSGGGGDDAAAAVAFRTTSAGVGPPHPPDPHRGCQHG